MTTTGPNDQTRNDQTRRDAAALEPFFTAARRSEPAPSQALLSAILADAGEATAARAAVPPDRTPSPRADRPKPRRGFLAALGDWRVAGPLAAATLVGFWIGVAGTVDLGDRTAWTTTTADSDADPVAGFFDLASAE